jgi:peroxiredoxin
MRRAGIATGCLLAAACGGAGVPAPAGVGDAAPPYQAVSVAGDSVRLDQFSGQVVLLNVWATWCEPCREEMPALEVLHRELGAAGLRIMAASIDVRTADHEVRQFIADYDLTFPVLRDPDDRVSRIFQLSGVPNTVLVGRDGVIVHRWIGEFDPLTDDARATIRQALDS